MDVVKTIERLGSSSGKPAAQVRISDCGVTTPPAKAAAISPASAGSKRPADSGATNKIKKASVEDNSTAEGIDNPEKNQKKIQLSSGLEYVDIKVRAPAYITPLLTAILKVGTGQVASGGKKIVVGYKGVLKVPYVESL